MRLACWMAWVCVLLSGCGGATTAEPSADGPGCTRTTDRATIGVVASWNGAARDCGAVDMGSDAVTIALDGRLVAVTPDSFTVDECPLGGAPCSPQLTTFSVAAPGLALALPEGAFVHLKYRVHRFFACIKSLELGTVASLYGMPNPAGPSGVLLLAITDGGAAFDDSPYTVDRRALGCRPDAGPTCGGPAVDEYAFVFAPTAAPEQTVEVGMGQTKPLDLHQGPFGAWNARNLRSFETGYCDDYWNYAYFIAWLPPVK